VFLADDQSSSIDSDPDYVPASFSDSDSDIGLLNIGALVQHIDSGM